MFRLPAVFQLIISLFLHTHDNEDLLDQQFTAKSPWNSHNRAPTVRQVDLVVQNEDISPDGFLRSGVLVGDSFPGPLIRGIKGDRFRINVTNLLTDNETMEASTSIHWHGIHQTHTNWEDGSAGVTQCPIPSKHSFVYEFDVHHQAGTFWYHSHYSTQYCDGLRGPFVVYDPDDPHRHLYDVDDENTIITLADWYHLTSRLAMPPNSLPPLADSILINGRGRSPEGPKTPLAVINVEYGKRYRLRLIQMACDPNFNFTIDDHEMTIIEADSIATKPYTVDFLPIYAGQRYSLVLHANQPIDNYWIRANPNTVRAESGFRNSINSAILRYTGAPPMEPSPRRYPQARKPLVETSLKSLMNTKPPGQPYPGGADITINLQMAFDFETFLFTVNGAVFDAPKVPVILQILSGAENADLLLPKGSVYVLPPNKVVELSIPGTIEDLGGPHPFHLHGHDFYVIKPAYTNEYNFEDPVRRDTLNTGFEDSNATVRFTTDNAGPWFLHCHVDWHLEMGLAVVFAEDTRGTKIQSAHVPDTWRELCMDYDAVKKS